MARSPFVPMDQGKEQGAGRGAAGNNKERQEEEVLLVHSQVRRIKKEDEEAFRERLLKLRLLETRPNTGAGGVAWRAPRSLSPLRRAGSAIIPVPVSE
ncbi:uncharacterized protein [Zea mays]|jgi:hypothetical protein|uniref:Uncharacterized protein n=2 Tax=Zea mays TaxID=4577 RepID=B4FTX5_MAIZE|nr:uncharacterized protein LOC118472959 [Zea mays]ACF85568.1 unknown [Zea mays]